MSRPRIETSPVPVMLLRPAEAAAMIGLSRTKTYELIARGELPSVRFGGSVRVPLDALRALIAHKLTEGARP